MKKIILVLALSTFILSSEASNSINTPPGVSIFGEWKGADIQFTGTAEGEVEVSGFLLPISTEVSGDGYDYDFSYTLTTGSDIATSEGKYNMKVTYFIFGVEQTENEENLKLDFSGPWNKSGNTLTLTVDGKKVVAKISRLTKTTLILEFPVKRITKISGNDFNLDLNMTVTFKR